MGNIRARVKVLAAAVAAGAVVTMGALAALIGTEAPQTKAITASAGDTSTQATPPPTPPTAMAVPPVKVQKWQGAGWPGQ